MTCNVIFKGLGCQEKNNNEKENVQRKILRIPNYIYTLCGTGSYFVHASSRIILPN